MRERVKTEKVKVKNMMHKKVKMEQATTGKGKVENMMPKKVKMEKVRIELLVTVMDIHQFTDVLEQIGGVKLLDAAYWIRFVSL